MVSLSQSLNRVQLSGLQTAIDELNNDINSQEWYWGNTSKEEVNEYMAGLQDGYFLVRDSSDKNLGMYTLTVRKEGENKLVRIICRGGLYGFQEPCQFESVPKLIKYYQTHKLSEYNEQLNLMLRYSCSKIRSEVKGNKYNNDELIKLLSKTMTDISDVNAKVEKNTDTYNDIQKELDEVTKALKAIDRIRIWCKSHSIHIMNIINSNNRTLWDEHCKKCLVQLNKKLNDCDQGVKDMNELRDKLITESDELHSQLQTDRPNLKNLNKSQYEIIRSFKDRGVSDEIFSSESVDNIDNLCENIRNALNLNNPINIKSNWFIENISRDQAFLKLSKRQDGTFLIRRSTEPQNYTLDIKVNGVVQHCRIFCQNGNYGFEKDLFYQSLEDLVKNFHVHRLSKYNDSLTTILAYPVNK